VILSDVTIREELAAGRIVIEPLGPNAVQPSSVDIRLDRFFRVFRNATTPYIDPKEPQEDLTELVEVKDGDAFILHPGEFVLGSTLELVKLPNDLVGRIEGKSSMGRLGLLIHSSLPASETVLLRRDGRVEQVAIGDIVAKRLSGDVVSFDPDTFAVGYHPITGWYEGPPDRIFEVRLASGRRVRVTAGHNLFTLDDDAQLRRIRTGEVRPGVRIAVPHRIPDVEGDAPRIDVLDFIPEQEYSRILLHGPAVARLFANEPGDVAAALRGRGIRHVDCCRGRAQLPLDVALMLDPVIGARLRPADAFSYRGSLHRLPAVLEIDEELAWFLGICVAEGSRHRNRFTISNTDRDVLVRASSVLARLGLATSRGDHSITCCSGITADFLGWIGTGHHAATKRVPTVVWSLPQELLEAFLEGLVDGDASREAFRTSVWTASEGLAADVVLLAARLGRRAGTSSWRRGRSRLFQVCLAEHEQQGDLLWDEVLEVRDTGTMEPIFDLEVRPNGRRIENFLAGAGGVFVSNTAGFIDAGWEGHLTLELSNVATLPIALYPGMRIGQISFLRMTTPAEHPYGSGEVGSKYQGQRGPTPSRYHLNFRDGD